MLSLVTNTMHSLGAALNPKGEFPVQEYIRSYKPLNGFATSMMGLLFEKLSSQSDLSNQDKIKIATCCSILYKITDLADDIVDGSKMPINEQVDYLNQVKRCIFADEIIPSNNVRDQSIMLMAKTLRNELQEYAGFTKLETVLDNLINIVKDQPEVKDLHELMKVAVRTGEFCGEMTLVIGEIVTGIEDPTAKKAARALGAFAELLDTYCDVDDDLKEGTNTYATQKLILDGDTPENRAAIQKALREEANKCFNEGRVAIENLPFSTRFEYVATKYALSLKYRKAFL